MEVLWDFVFMLICWIKSVCFCCSWFETIEDELLYSLPVGTSSYAHCWHLRINCFTDCHPNSFVLRAVFPKIRNSDLEDAGDVFLERQQRKENRSANAQFLQACGLWIMFQQIFILFCLFFSCKLAQRGGGRSSKAVWTWSWATCYRCPCLSGKVGPYELQRSLPTSTVLCFCDLQRSSTLRLNLRLTPFSWELIWLFDWLIKTMSPEVQRWP